MGKDPSAGLSREGRGVVRDGVGVWGHKDLQPGGAVGRGDRPGGTGFKFRSEVSVRAVTGVAEKGLRKVGGQVASVLVGR